MNYRIIRVFIITTIFVLLNNDLFCQRIIKGKIKAEEGIDFFAGLAVIDSLSLPYGTIVGYYGDFSLEVNDSSKYIFIFKNLPEPSDFQYKKIDIRGKNVLNFVASVERNTFDTIPKSFKIQKRKFQNEKYNLRYSIHDTLKSIICRTESSKYVGKLTYSKDFIHISWYIKPGLFKKLFYLSSIRFCYDKRGAIRQRDVSVEYGYHSSSYIYYYYYRNNIVNRIECNYWENYGQGKHETTTNVELDPLMILVQNEIIRKKLYLKCSVDAFEFDNKLTLIE